MTDKKEPVSLPDPRTFSIDIDFKQSPERVWQALTDPTEISRWFSNNAEVEPTEGGQFEMTWDVEGWGFRTRVATWKPNQHLGLIEEKDHQGQKVVLAMDYYLEGRNGGTTLRLVHSGFGRDEDWDQEFSGISRGWPYELRVLRHYLDHHPDTPRHLRLVTHHTDLAPRDAFSRVFGPKGLAKNGGVHALSEGDSFRLEVGPQEVYAGKVFLVNPPRSWAGTLNGPHGGLLRFEMEADIVVLSLARWGGNANEVNQFADVWQQRLAELL